MLGVLTMLELEIIARLTTAGLLVPTHGPLFQNRVREQWPTVEFGVLFRLASAEQSGTAPGEDPGIQSINKELRGMKAVVSEANRVYSGGSKTAVEHASAGVWTARDIGNTPLRKVTGLQVGRAIQFAN